ncbi:MAG: glycosyltransferase family 9 protein [Chloroflexota bacterium]|nr:glycosyltransferase family 9 protein [Chloroflexota bacterium]
MSQIKSRSSKLPERILIIPFADGIGDFVNMQPLVIAVARRFPQADISVAASSYANYLVSPQQPVRVVTPSWFKQEPSPFAQSLRHFIPQIVLAWFAAPVLKRELDVDIDLVINTVYLWERNLDFPHYWTPQVPARPGAVHTLDCIADALEEELGIYIPPAQRYPQLYVRTRSREWAEDFILREELNGLPLVALIPESNMLIKKWPAAEWAYLNDSLQERGFRTLLFADARDCALSRQVIAHSKHPPLFVSAKLDNVAALLERCALAVGVDTGLLHMAASVGTRWLGLFGPTNPEVTGPYDRRLGRGLVAPFVKVEGCRNCWKSFKYEDDECRTLENRSCMSLLERNTVLEASLELLEPVRV